jgi:hypothetical protein
MKATQLIVMQLVSVGLFAHAQGTFQNLNFESTTLTHLGGDVYSATIPGWAWNGFNFLGGDTNQVAFNNIALDAPAVTLHGLSSVFYPAIQGSNSVVLQGGSLYSGPYGTNGVSIFQTGQVPAGSHSLTYLAGSPIQVAFNGQTLSPVAISNAPTYTVWGVDISAYAGKPGELRFTAAWLSTSTLDGIRFSNQSIPEPSLASLAALGAFGCGWHSRRGRRSSR